MKFSSKHIVQLLGPSALHSMQEVSQGRHVKP